MLKAIAQQLTPPIAWNGLKAVRKRVFPKPVRVEGEAALFDGDDGFFLAAAEGIRVYHEYGVGFSTKWIDTHTEARIVGVDTSLEWIKGTSASFSRKGHSLMHVDLGPVGPWGRPLGFSHRDRFMDYVEGPWRESATADLVLIDGRFRISCFLTTLLRGEAGTKIIFDDYSRRQAYHVVEEFLRPVRKSERQGFFVIPERFDRDAVTKARDAFLMVRE